MEEQDPLDTVLERVQTPHQMQKAIRDVSALIRLNSADLHHGVKPLEHHIEYFEQQLRRISTLNYRPKSLKIDHSVRNPSEFRDNVETFEDESFVTEKKRLVYLAALYRTLTHIDEETEIAEDEVLSTEEPTLDEVREGVLVS